MNKIILLSALLLAAPVAQADYIYNATTGQGMYYHPGVMGTPPSLPYVLQMTRPKPKIDNGPTVMHFQGNVMSGKPTRGYVDGSGEDHMYTYSSHTNQLMED